MGKRSFVSKQLLLVTSIISFGTLFVDGSVHTIHVGDTTVTERDSITNKPTNENYSHFLKDFSPGVNNKCDNKPVEVTLDRSVCTRRDAKGVWFISGPCSASLYSVFEAMGYAVATDRLWQMELFRRQARGSLAEIFGQSFLPNDIYIRTTGYSQKEINHGFKKLPRTIQNVLHGYVAGINRFIAQARHDRKKMPAEFCVLNFDPTPWSYADVLRISILMQRRFDSEADESDQLLNGKLLQQLHQKFGSDAFEMFNDLRWKHDSLAPTMIHKNDEDASNPIQIVRTSSKQSLPGLNYSPAFIDLTHTAEAFVSLHKTMADNVTSLNAEVKMGSYAWVIGKQHSASGNPILYAGPQFSFSTPTMIVEGSIQAAGLSVSGMSVPGTPFFAIGRTPHHCWSSQVGHCRTTDFYLENITSVALHHRDTIKINGKPSIILPVYRSKNGPIISPTSFDPATITPTEPIIAWKYSHWNYELTGIKAYFEMVKAQTIDEFGKAVKQLGVSQHICYADRDGTIAYWMSGRDPIRPSGEWRLPQGTLKDQPVLQWDAAVVKPIPHDRNCKTGFYGGWNNKSYSSSESGYNNSFFYFGPFHRAHAVEDYFHELLASENAKISFEQIEACAVAISATKSFSYGGNPWKFIDADFKKAVLADPTPQRLKALEILSTWDGKSVDGGAKKWIAGTDVADGYILMNAWIERVLQFTFADEIDSTQPNYLLFNVLIHALAGSNASVPTNHNWFINYSDSQMPQTAEQIITVALDSTLAALGERPWGMSKRPVITMTHQLFGKIHSFPAASRSCYTQIVEMGSVGPVRISSMFPLGQSGMIRLDKDNTPIFDQHFFDMSKDEQGNPHMFDTFTPRSFPLFQ